MEDIEVATAAAAGRDRWARIFGHTLVLAAVLSSAASLILALDLPAAGVVTSGLRPALAVVLAAAAAATATSSVARRRVTALRLQQEGTLQAHRAKAAARDEFVAVISRHLQAGLGGIHGFAEYLLERPDESGTRTQELLDIITEDAAELTRNVQDVIAAVELEAGRMQFDPAPIDLLEVASSEARRLRRKTDRSIQVHGTPTFVWADAARVRHIVRNLTSNALRYGGERVDLVVTTSRDGGALVVADDGPGIPEPVRERIVEPQSGDLLDQPDHMGIRVATALSRGMDGSLRHERRLGWTNFLLTLPSAPTSVIHDVLAQDAQDEFEPRLVRAREEPELVAFGAG